MIYTSNTSDLYVNTNDDQVINWYLLNIKRHTNKSKALMFKSNKTSEKQNKNWAQHKCINVHLIELYQKEGGFFSKKKNGRVSMISISVIKPSYKRKSRMSCRISEVNVQ